LKCGPVWLFRWSWTPLNSESMDMHSGPSMALNSRTQDPPALPPDVGITDEYHHACLFSLFYICSQLYFFSHAHCLFTTSFFDLDLPCP
jgi:hypothetical protein